MTTVQGTCPHPHFMAEEAEAESYEGVCTESEELGSNPGLHKKWPLFPACKGYFLAISGGCILLRASEV